MLRIVAQSSIRLATARARQSVAESFTAGSIKVKSGYSLVCIGREWNDLVLTLCLILECFCSISKVFSWSCYHPNGFQVWLAESWLFNRYYNCKWIELHNIRCLMHIDWTSLSNTGEQGWANWGKWGRYWEGRGSRIQDRDQEVVEHCCQLIVLRKRSEWFIDLMLQSDCPLSFVLTFLLRIQIFVR